jgi:hypothetical protein
MACFSCGKTFKGTVNDLLQMYKQDYLKRGVERYFFKENENGDVKICSKESFKRVYELLIQPNLMNGAEYAHIKEFRNV